MRVVRSDRVGRVCASCRGSAPFASARRQCHNQYEPISLALNQVYDPLQIIPLPHTHVHPLADLLALSDLIVNMARTTGSAIVAMALVLAGFALVLDLPVRYRSTYVC